VTWFPILLGTHILLAVALLAPSLILPFLLRRSPDADAPNAFTRGLIAMQGTGSLFVAVGLAVTGAGLLAILGTELLREPWLIVALCIYALNLLIAALISRPNLRRLVGIGRQGDEDAWRRRARQQRYVAYVMAAATGAIGFLMSTKPALW
jgi:Predicted integral membrane protein (DUF2269)